MGCFHSTPAPPIPSPILPPDKNRNADPSSALSSLQAVFKPIHKPKLPLTAFDLFPRLPSELRLKIWAYTCSNPRNVNIIVDFALPSSYPNAAGGYREAHDYRWTSSTPIPAILHSTRESRVEALRHFKLGFASTHDVLTLEAFYQRAHHLEDPYIAEMGWDIERIEVMEARVYFNPAFDRICISAHREGRLPMAGLVAALREIAGSETRFLGLGLVTQIGDYMRHAHEWAHLDSLGRWDEEPWAGTKLQEIMFFGKVGELDVPDTRGTLMVTPASFRDGLFTTLLLEEGDVAKVICAVRDKLFGHCWNDRIVGYCPLEGKMKWPDIEYRIFYIKCNCHRN